MDVYRSEINERSYEDRIKRATVVLQTIFLIITQYHELGGCKENCKNKR